MAPTAVNDGAIENGKYGDTICQHKFNAVDGGRKRTGDEILDRGRRLAAAVLRDAAGVPADGLWVAGLTAHNERTPSFRWQPEMMTQTVRQQTVQAKPFVHATLAACWYDLLVAGDEVFVTSGRQPRPFTQKGKSDARAPATPSSSCRDG